MPFSLFILLLFSIIILQSVSKYEVEKQYFENSKTMDQLESLLYTGIHQFEKIADYPLMKEEVFTFDVGVVSYKVMEESEQQVTVQFQCNTWNEGEYLVQIIWNPIHQEIIAWQEL
ncbi:competence type IV pilus minor pilin ComGG [Caldibacillus lycopersici]|uniref:Competence type IV pilus minor pilin ComGG n=1 Tax=Perspicuibacillus lycopersici TaxID=1325689 RepID=A0AAE3LNF9_9BACI|nr:competence type IV pilus minor pilin ComGG [Perspicuibacillus lycopersici]MCU9613856.1 competence type IV pilus minor pilin ComGG [Perspicuibacillus lycopersici]